MGKKSRSKRSPHKGRPANQASRQSPQPQLPTSFTPASLSGEAVPATVQPVAQAAKPATTLDVHTQFIRGDILRITLLLVLVGIILGCFTILNGKSLVLRRAGERLTNFLQLQ